jgi:hypothetical protein
MFSSPFSVSLYIVSMQLWKMSESWLTDVVLGEEERGWRGGGENRIITHSSKCLLPYIP